MSVQDIFFTLPEETEGTNVFVKAISALNKHFKPQAKVPYERLVFRETKQSVSETVEQYITRLRQKAHTCEFGETSEEQIRDQVIRECFKNFLVKNGIEQQMTTPLWPQANGEIERQNRSILKRLRIAQAEGRNLRLEVD